MYHCEWCSLSRIYSVDLSIVKDQEEQVFTRESGLLRLEAVNLIVVMISFRLKSVGNLGLFTSVRCSRNTA